MLRARVSRQLWPLGRLVLLEAWRTHLPGIALLVAIGGLGLAQFLAQVAITETDLIRVTVLAALYRLAAVFILASFVVASVQREFADQGVQLAMSLPVARASFCLGKLLGFAVCAVVLALLFGLALELLPESAHGTWKDVALWGASLAAELVLVATLASFCAFSLASSTGAIATVTGFYLLGRSIGAMQVIASSPLYAENAAWQELLNHAVDAIALLLPRLDLFTRGAWLSGVTPGGGELAIVFGQAALYVVLLAVALLFDFYRREL